MSEQDELLQEFTTYLSYKLGIYMGQGLFKNYPDNFNEQVPKLAGELLAKVKQHYEQKGLDRPELREKVRKIIQRDRELSDIQLGEYEPFIYFKGDTKYTVDQVLALFPDIEQMCKDCKSLEMFLSENRLRESVEEAKKQEKERVYTALADFADEIIKAPEMHGDKQLDLVWAADFIEWWQALKEAK